jgi:hypothetical protein
VSVGRPENHTVAVVAGDKSGHLCSTRRTIHSTYTFVDCTPKGLGLERSHGVKAGDAPVRRVHEGAEPRVQSLSYISIRTVKDTFA